MSGTSASIFSPLFVFLIVLGFLIIGFIYNAIKNFISGNRFKNVEKDIKVVISLWIPILIIELFSFYLVVHSPSNISELLFYTVLILVTLTVGVTLISAFKNKDNK